MTDATPYILILDDALVPVTNLFDDCGEDVERWEDAERFVAGPLPDGTWMSDLTSEYMLSRSH